MKKFNLDIRNKRIAGVCAGLANYFDIDVTLVRILFVAALFLGFSLGFWVYLILWIIAPKD